MSSSPDGPGSRAHEEALRRWHEVEQARARADAAQDALLASDRDRAYVCSVLNQAFSDGRLTTADHDERTSRALAARTHGDLDAVLVGLVAVAPFTPPGAGHAGAYPPPTARGPGPRLVFWLSALLASPLVLVGLLVLFFGGLLGTDLSSVVIGLVLLGFTVPGLFGLFRWAYPRT